MSLSLQKIIAGIIEKYKACMFGTAFLSRQMFRNIGVSVFNAPCIMLFHVTVEMHTIFTNFTGLIIAA